MYFFNILICMYNFISDVQFILIFQAPADLWKIPESHVVSCLNATIYQLKHLHKHRVHVLHRNTLVYLHNHHQHQDHKSILIHQDPFKRSRRNHNLSLQLKFHNQKVSHLELPVFMHPHLVHSALGFRIKTMSITCTLKWVWNVP